MRRLLAGMIRVYQILTVWMPPVCRYTPSCSTYAMDAIRLHGPVRGCWMAARRIGRCHPWHEGGFDPVPPPAPGGRG